MSAYEEVYRHAAALLTEHAVPDAALDAWYLLEHVTGLRRAEYFLRAKKQALREDSAAIPDRGAGIYGISVCGKPGNADSEAGYRMLGGRSNKISAAVRERVFFRREGA